VIQQAQAYADAGADLLIINLPLHAPPDSLPPLAEAFKSLAG
jgi:2-methylisocitrate lyase-like PEP mutase family enzyme